MKHLKKNRGFYFTFLGAVLICTGILFLNHAFSFGSISDTLKHFCDGFSITGFLFLALAVLIWIANEGTFTMLSYAFQKIFSSKKKSYYEYHLNRLNHPTSNRSLILVGGIFFLVGLIFLLLFYII